MIRRAGWGFSLICGLSQDKWPSKMGTYHWEGHQVFLMHICRVQSQVPFSGVCAHLRDLEKTWDRHIPLRSYGDLRTNLWVMGPCQRYQLVVGWVPMSPQSIWGIFFGFQSLSTEFQLSCEFVTYFQPHLHELTWLSTIQDGAPKIAFSWWVGL